MMSNSENDIMEKICLIEDHLIPALEGRMRYTNGPVWENRNEGIVRIGWKEKFRPGTRNWKAEYGKWFLDWDVKKRRPIQHTSNYISKSKERVRNALRKQKSKIKELDDDKLYKRYKLLQYKPQPVHEAPSSSNVNQNQFTELNDESPKTAICESETSDYESGDCLYYSPCSEIDSPESQKLDAAEFEEEAQPCPNLGSSEVLNERMEEDVCYPYSFNNTDFEIKMEYHPTCTAQPSPILLLETREQEIILDPLSLNPIPTGKIVPKEYSTIENAAGFHSDLYYNDSIRMPPAVEMDICNQSMALTNFPNQQTSQDFDKLIEDCILVTDLENYFQTQNNDDMSLWNSLEGIFPEKAEGWTED